MNPIVNRRESAAQDLDPVADICSIFVYGTLMRGESRFSVFMDFKPECILLADAPGSLLDLGAYPGMIPPLDQNSYVQGEFMRFKPEDMPELLKVLDQIERFRGFGEPGSLYHRSPTLVHVGDGRIRKAWVYMLAEQGGDLPIIPSGDWREHRGSKSQFLRSLTGLHTNGNQRAAARYIVGTNVWASSTGEDLNQLAQSFLPLQVALEQGRVSERKLAQFSGQWAVIPDMM